MADAVKISFEGFQEFTDLVNEIKEDFSVKDSKQIINKGMKLAMQPALEKSKALVPIDTGALAASLRIEARAPTGRDKRSIYVNDSDIAIATVTTAPGNVLAKTRYVNQRNPITLTKKNGKSWQLQTIGITSDARAMANEFGTAKMAAHPFLRPGLESSSDQVTNLLGDSLGSALENYKSKHS